MPIQPVSGEIKAQPLNDNFSYLDSKTSNISKGAPSGKFETLAALKATYPNGNTNIYLVLADGNWYFWNGTSWEIGGKYQETGLADGAVKDEKVADAGIKPGKLDRQTVATEQLQNASVNGLQAEFIKIDGQNIYDKNLNEIGGINIADGSSWNDSGAENYIRSGYLDVRNVESIEILDSSRQLNTFYLFAYQKIGDKAVKINELYAGIIKDGYRLKTIHLNKEFNYIRILVKGGLYNIVNSLEIKAYNSDKADNERLSNEKFLSQFQLDTSLVKMKDIQLPINLYDPYLSAPGGLNQDGTAASTDGYSRSSFITLNYGESAEGKTFKIYRENMVEAMTDFMFLSKDTLETDFTAISDQSISYVFDGNQKAIEFKVPTGSDYRFFRFVDGNASTSEEIRRTITLYEVVEKEDVVICGQSLSKYFRRKDDPLGDNRYLERPTNGVVNFQVDINTSMMYQETENTLAVQDAETLLKDDCVLLLPTNYNPSGAPVSLVISCHGAGTTITSTTTGLGAPAPYLLRMGYAVLDCNGIPKSLSNNTGLHYGSPMALQSYLKAYDYVIKRYNVKHEVFVHGTSMGGLTSNMLVQSGSIPVVAQSGYCPVTDHFKQAYCAPWSSPGGQRSQIAKLFGFTGETPIWTAAKYPSQAEIDFYLSNMDKVVAYNPIIKNTINYLEIDPYLFEAGSEQEKLEYFKLIKHHPVPVKFWHNDDDTTVAARYSEFFIQSIKNSGGLAYLRRFPSGDHNAWENGDKVTIKDMNGNNMSVNASIFELILWYKRFV